ncbi:MAG: tetratricopeptide repeat protein [Acetobacteraceae bacterium]|nr:tetratricopeptide repeat protein [Acetobacteraceae bacterium]
MSIVRDGRGLELTASGAATAAAHDGIVEAFLKYRAATPQLLKAALDADPDAPMLHAMRGAFTLMAYKSALLPAAREAIATAARLAGTERERAHAAALDAWADGAPERAAAIWRDIVARHPTDILAFRLHHFCAFWMGRAPEMLAVVEAALPAWDPGLPGWGSMLACRAFANEECGNHRIAESAGREAVRLDPGDLWAVHAVAHVMEMEGRRGEGIAWVEAAKPRLAGASNLAHHIVWHQAMFHLERGDHAEVLRLYDTGFRNLDSPLTQANPDLYIDVQNAASMLFRLERQGVDVGDRWEELAEKAETRIGDCASPFTLPHWMMALCATGRLDAARRMLDAIRDAGRGNAGEHARILREAAAPACEALLRRAEGDFSGAVAALRPALGTLPELGGSHAQQDVLEQLFLDCALRADAAEDIRTLLERVAGRWPTPPERRAGYRAALG